MRPPRPLLFALLGCAACAPAEPPIAPPPGALPPAPPPAPAFVAGRGGTFRSERFNLRLPLPDGDAWRIDDHGSSWLTAAHAASSSTLVVRVWHEDGRATRARCEDQARLRRALPERGAAEILQDRGLEAPAGFDTRLLVGIVAPKPGAPLGAFAVAFGAHGHRCFAWAFTTSAAGPGAERVVGERLAAMIEGSLSRVVIESDLTPRIEREPARPRAVDQR